MPDYNKQLKEATENGNIDQARDALLHGAGLHHKIPYPFNDDSYHPVEVDALFLSITSSKATLQQKMDFLRFLKSWPGFNPNCEYEFKTADGYTTYKKSIFKIACSNEKYYYAVLMLLFSGAKSNYYYFYDSWSRTFIKQSDAVNNLVKLYDFSLKKEEWEHAYEFYGAHEKSNDTPLIFKDSIKTINPIYLFWISCFLGRLGPLAMRLTHEEDRVKISKHRSDLLEVSAHVGTIEFFTYLLCYFDSSLGINFSQVKKLVEDNKNREMSPILNKAIEEIIWEKGLLVPHPITSKEELSELTLFLYTSFNEDDQDTVMDCFLKDIPGLVALGAQEIVDWLELALLKKGFPLFEKLLPVVSKLVRHSEIIEEACCRENIEFINFLFEQGADPYHLSKKALLSLSRKVVTRKFPIHSEILETELKSEFGDTLIDTLLREGYLAASPRSDKQAYCSQGPSLPDEQLFEAAKTCDTEKAKSVLKDCVWVGHLSFICEEGVWQVRSVSDVCMLSPCTLVEKMAFFTTWIKNKSFTYLMDFQLNKKINEAKILFSFLAEKELNYPLVLLGLIYSKKPFNGQSVKTNELPSKIKSVMGFHAQFDHESWERTIIYYKDSICFSSYLKFIAEKPTLLFFLCCILNDWDALNKFNQQVQAEGGESLFKKMNMTYESLDALEIASSLAYNEFFMMTCLHCVDFNFESVLSLIKKYPPQKQLEEEGQYKSKIDETLNLALSENNMSLMSFFLFCYEDPELQDKIIAHLLENVESSTSYDEKTVLSWLELAVERTSPEFLTKTMPVISKIFSTYPEIFKQICLEKNEKLVRFAISQGLNPASLTDETLSELFLKKEQVQVSLALLEDDRTRVNWHDADQRCATLCVEASKTLSDDDKTALLFALIQNGGVFNDDREPKLRDHQLQARISRLVNIAEAVAASSQSNREKLQETNLKLNRQNEIAQEEAQQRLQLQ